MYAYKRGIPTLSNIRSFIIALSEPLQILVLDPGIPFFVLDVVLFTKPVIVGLLLLLFILVLWLGRGAQRVHGVGLVTYMVEEYGVLFAVTLSSLF